MHSRADGSPEGTETMASAPAGVPGIDLAALARYLPAVLDDYDPAAGLGARLLAGGRSNLTCLIFQPDGRQPPAVGQPEGSRQWVLRRPPLGHVMPSAHDMVREFRILSELDGTGFPAPRPRALCTDHSLLGVTFLVYDYVPGLVVSDEAAAAQMTARQADTVCGELVSTLARLHGLTPPAAPPGRSASATDYLRRQVTRWTGQWEHTATRDLPAFPRLARWLQDQVNGLTEDYEVTMVHGDYRLDNLILDPGTRQVRAVLDWEMSTLGDPLMDLALLLVYWEQPGDGLRGHVNVARNLTTGDGFWSREQLVGAYAGATARPLDHLPVCLALACLKLAVVMESIHYRHLSGQAIDPLSAGLGDAAPALLELGLAVASGHGLASLAA
jgi:aminoglycoside phosphotransferase (APT) family kinase protein